MSRSRLKRIRVLKFGSSVLRSPDDLQDVAAEVYRHVREGVSPVVVVSAYRGRTNELQRLAEGLSDESLSRAELLGIGESEAAAAVSVALERCGLPVRLLDSTDVGISATGTRDAGWPVAVDPQSVAAALGREEIFAGLDALRTDRGMQVILIAHAAIEKFANPETDTYDRYVPRLQKLASALVREWCDEVLFSAWCVVRRLHAQQLARASAGE